MITRSGRSTDIFHNYLEYCIYLLEVRRFRNSALVFPLQKQHFPCSAITRSSPTKLTVTIFPAILFSSFATSQVPNHPSGLMQKTLHEVQSAKIVPIFGIASLEEGARGSGRKPTPLFSIPDPGRDRGSARSWSIPAVSPHPSQRAGALQGASTGRCLPLASAAQPPLPGLPLISYQGPFSSRNKRDLVWSCE